MVKKAKTLFWGILLIPWVFIASWLVLFGGGPGMSIDLIIGYFNTLKTDLLAD